MKNIFIVGIPRSGKTTLSKMIKNEYPYYNQISFEAVRNGFIESQENLDMGNRNSSARKEILPKHIVTFAEWNNKISGYPSLVEGSFCNIKELNELISDDSIIICLGLGCRSEDDIINGIMTHDTENDYTKEWDKERIKKHFYDITDEDKSNYDYCINNNINYYDTYENRKEVFKNILDAIKNTNN